MKLIVLRDYNETAFALDIDADPIKCVQRPDTNCNPDFADEHDFPDEETKAGAAYFCSIITTMSGAQYKVGESVETLVLHIRNQEKCV
jgi:hypothetical protein